MLEILFLIAMIVFFPIFTLVLFVALMLYGGYLYAKDFIKSIYDKSIG
jgi:hypothetical protein